MRSGRPGIRAVERPRERVDALTTAPDEAIVQLVAPATDGRVATGV